jgi:hypothetical protein
MTSFQYALMNVYTAQLLVLPTIKLFASCSVKHPSMMPIISADSFRFTLPEMS